MMEIKGYKNIFMIKLIIHRKFIIAIALILMMVIVNCYDGQKEALRKDLNRLGESISKLALEFNNISDNQNLEDIENAFEVVDKNHQKVYDRIINNKVILNDKVKDYYKEFYIPAYLKVMETTNTLLEGDFSDASFTENYNKAGQNLNELIKIYNNLIGMLEK
jgi:hypothetical protein